MLEDLAGLTISIAFFATWALVCATVFWVYVGTRRMPPELIQLRVFEKHAVLRRAFLLIGLGMAAGLLAIADSFLSLPVTIAWDLTWALVWSAASIYGYLSLAFVFSPLRGRRGRFTR